MVTIRALWVILFFHLSLEAKATVELEPPQGIIETLVPFNVEVHILHDPSMSVDEHSFLLGGVKITPEKISDNMKRGEKEAVYRIHFPGYPEGVQLLPELQVGVGGEVVKTPPMTIQVGSAEKTMAQNKEPFLKLSVIYTGKDQMFPGQRAWIGYRIRFNRSIDLLEEKLPLLTPEGFKKLGEVQISDSESGNVTTREIFQRIEAVTPGKYSFDSSRIQGLVYEEGAAGTKKYIKPPLESSVSAVELSIAPFPEKDKPVSFAGAVGSYAIHASLAGPSSVSVEDPLKIKVSITGKGDLETLSLPDLCCQPGFSGEFRLSDLPPEVTIAQDTKIFAFDLFPLNGFLKKVPSIYFSFLDPEKIAYQVVQTDPIPIDVKESLPQLPKADLNRSEGAERKQESIPLEIPRINLITMILSWWDGWHLMIFLPLCLAMSYFFLFPPVKKSKRSFENLMKNVNSEQKGERFFLLLAKALQKGVEEGKIEDSEAYRLVKARLERRIYSTDKELTAEQAMKEAEALWEKE